MNRVHSNCDESSLVILLHGDEQSEEFQRSAAHIESCENCRRRLTELAADGDTWTEISESLRAEAVPLSGPSPDVTPKQLEFLRPPSHPEMLGRLGRYEIERVIGAGGMGIVLKAHDSELNRPVAIKVLAPHLAHSGAARQRFAREGRAAAAIVHEHVVAIHNVESEAEVPFLVMQFVPGRSLQARVDEYGPLGVKEILRIGTQAAAGLSAAHAQGVVHRDVKPSNILLENDVERVLLSDFGLARVADDASMTRSGIVAGTPHYMSPEQANGSPVDHRSDLFSLGAVLYFMATGHPPFRAERTMAVLNRICNDRQRPAWEVNPEVPVELSDLIDVLLEKKAQRRFGSAVDVQTALEELLQQFAQPGRSRLRSRCLRWWRRQRRRVLYAAIAMVGMIAVAGFNGWLSSGVPSEAPTSPVGLKQQETDAFAADVQAERELATTIREVQHDLQQIERRVADAGSFEQHGTAEWDAELADVKRELSQLERSLIIKPSTSGETR